MSGTVGVLGYRKLTQEEVDLINECKVMAETVYALWNKVGAHQAMAAGVDKRWHAEARTDLQKGFMCLIRSIAQPTTF
jgi:hypothetical protein